MGLPVRVTEVLNYFKEPWYIEWIHKVGKRTANLMSKRAMKIGTRVDELIKTGSSPLTKDNDEVKVAYGAFKKWKENYSPILLNGARLYGKIDDIEITGEPDLIVGGNIIVDIKCSSKISPSYWIQVNMYAKLLGDPKINSVAILRLDKVSGSYEYVIKELQPNLCDVWVGLFRAMRYLQGDDHGGDDVYKDRAVEEVA